MDQSTNNELKRIRRAAIGTVFAGVIGIAIVHSNQASATVQPHSSDVRRVSDVLSEPSDKIDFATAKVTFDKLVDPHVDVHALLQQVDEMVETIRTMAGSNAPPRLRLITLRRYIYEPGPWNGNRPYQYDLTDPLGKKPTNRLLSTYLATRRGNCVSMPALFVALAQRLGLKATLSTAPNHIFVKYFDDVTGRTLNLETTSGAHVARDVWIRQNMSMTDQAIANGLYMKTFSKKEAVAVLAGVVLEHELDTKHYQAALELSGTLRQYYPSDLEAILAPATAAAWILKLEYRDKYPRREDIPPELMDRFYALEHTVSGAFNQAYALGWRETDGEAQPSATRTK